MATWTPKLDTEEERTELEYRDGNSDKMYIAIIHKIGDGYKVEFKYGKRYQVGNSSFKPNEPVPYGEVLGMYNEQIQKKRKKGYVDAMY